MSGLCWVYEMNCAGAILLELVQIQVEFRDSQSDAVVSLHSISR